MQKDLVICQVPFTETAFPLMAGAVLKSIAEKAGWSSILYDFNQLYFDKIKKDYNASRVVDFLLHETHDTKILPFVKQMFSEMADKIIEHQPKLVAISVFTYCSRTSAVYLSMMIKQKSPNIKIIAGGSGLYDGVMMKTDFADHMRRMKLLDHYIIGDAEHSFLEFLKDNKNFGGINNADWQQIANKDLDVLPHPNYNDHQWSIYERKAIPITGSRGCVRKCTFCNDILHWKKFSFRSADSIFEEMLAQSNKYGLYHFQFSDALINGNVKEFRSLCQKLADYNNSNQQQLSWDSQFIFRPRKQFAESDWDNLKASGVSSLSVGVESLDEDIRYDMGKKFDQEDLEYNLYQCQRLKIEAACNIIVGYPLEDEKSIDKSKQWLADNTHFNDYMKLNFGGTMALFPDTPLFVNAEKYGITIDGPPWQNWWNQSSTPQLRKKWWSELVACAKSNGYHVQYSFENSIILEGLDLSNAPV